MIHEAQSKGMSAGGVDVSGEVGEHALREWRRILLCDVIFLLGSILLAMAMRVAHAAMMAKIASVGAALPLTTMVMFRWPVAMYVPTGLFVVVLLFNMRGALLKWPSWATAVALACFSQAVVCGLWFAGLLPLLGNR